MREAPDLELLEKQYLGPIVGIFLDIDTIFLSACQKALTLKADRDYYNEWKSRIIITKQDVAAFKEIHERHKNPNQKPTEVLSDQEVLIHPVTGVQRSSS